jgi:hypothetical protein
VKNKILLDVKCEVIDLNLFLPELIVGLVVSKK